MFDKDLYEILGVKKSATDTEIRKAFLKLAKKFHPDVNPGNKEAEQKFKEVNLAYEVLKDTKKRAQYDQMRAAGANPFARGQAPGGGPGAGQGGFGPDIFGDLGLGDLFEEIFGQSFGGQGRGGARGRAHRSSGGFGFPEKGRDQEAVLPISFLDAARGGEKTFELASGKRITTKIPEGVENGTKIKLSQQGEAGPRGGQPGDLILKLEIEPHPYFVREGNNIILKLPITVSEAILGSEISVPTLSGNVVMKIPAGVSSGQRLKLSGKGIRSAKTGLKGDQFVELQIKIPKERGPSYTRAAEILREDKFRPREGLFN